MNRHSALCVLMGVIIALGGIALYSPRLAVILTGLAIALAGVGLLEVGKSSK